MLQERLYYLGNNAIANKSKAPFGYDEYTGLEQYNNVALRNVRVVRVDLLRYIDVFSNDTLNNYRDVIYYILSGRKGDMDKINNALSFLHDSDATFKLFLGKIYYFREDKYSHLSVYDTILHQARDLIGVAWDTVVNTVPHVKVLLNSHLYIYMSVSQNIDINTLLDINGLELISR